MLEVPKVGVEPDVLVGLVVAVEVAHDGEVGRIGHPEVATAPCEPLDGVEARREDLGRVGLAVAVGVEHEHDGVAGGLGLGIAVLRPHADAEAAPGVEGHRARLADERFAGKERDDKPRRHGGQRVAVGVGIFKGGLCDGGCGECYKGEREAGDVRGRP